MVTARRRRVLVVLFQGFELLDLAGVSSVFSNATQVLRREAHGRANGYELIVLSTNGGVVQSQDGVSVGTRPLSCVRVGSRDTVLVVGGEAKCVEQAAEDQELLKFLLRAGNKAERVGSVCTGALVLAASGVARGKNMTTHWNALDKLKSRYKDIRSCEDALYVNDGHLWTSAGVSTGIDMALAMVEHDHGRSLMGKVAQLLVVYSRRPGYQTQFSPILRTQTEVASKFDVLTRWMLERLSQPIRVEDMAKTMGMSKRTFCRHFVDTCGHTPAHFLLRLRLERAKELLEAGESVKSVAIDVGFRSESGFRRAFESFFGVTPSAHRSVYGDSGAC